MELGGEAVGEGLGVGAVPIEDGEETAYAAGAVGGGGGAAVGV